MKLSVLGSNQTQIETDRYIVLFSYNTPVAYIDKIGSYAYRTAAKHSKTTTKHINQWLQSFDQKKVVSTDQSFLDNLL